MLCFASVEEEQRTSETICSSQMMILFQPSSLFQQLALLQHPRTHQLVSAREILWSYNNGGIGDKGSGLEL